MLCLLTFSGQQLDPWHMMLFGTCRAKFGEAAFLDVYQKLYEAPDPAPTLNGAMVRLVLAQQSSAHPGSQAVPGSPFPCPLRLRKIAH